MLVPISIPSSSSNAKLPSALAKISHDEIVLIELQGALEVECNHPSERDGKLVGMLGIEEGSNKPTLRIGHHLLEGKISALAKPLAILHRSVPGDPVSKEAPSDNAMECDSSVDAAKDGSRAGWNIVGVVKKKIVFAKRPMPIVGRVGSMDTSTS
ncbi:Ctf8-domain-containing protein [Crucibulum laeve]|uniref:Ctf8-domain-containing protein n=1 Tax=Crucibulum laeve TaxID=68775 RepID=A0A5C3M4J5_9AGAR|nr:Ctf8-domain-containing protein [Crucibulum laeve]